MKLDPSKQSAHAAVAAYTALYGDPLTDAERREFNRQKAEEMARAEARREPTPQMELKPECGR